MGAEASLCSLCKGPPNQTPGDSSPVRATSAKTVTVMADAEVSGAAMTATPSDGMMADDENQRRMARMQGAGRRQAVAAEGMSAAAVKDYKKPVYQKDPAVKQMITGIIKTNEKLQVLFGHLDAAALEDVVNAFREVQKRQGEDVIRQGDEGDCLYIVNEGNVEVFVARPGPDGQIAPGDKGSKVLSLGPGALVGELALMYSAPRAATVTISSPLCRLFQLDREPFKMLLAQQGQQQFDIYEGWLAEIEIFKTLNRYELARLSELLESTLYDEGEEIVRQGDMGDTFFILEDGTCAAYINGAAGEKMVKEYNKQGDYFGEIALIKHEPRKATVRATGEGCSVLSIREQDFTEVMGPITEILAKDVDKYPQYAQLLR